MYQLLIIDDEPLTRTGIRKTIPWKKHGIEVAGEADNGKTGLDLALRLRPDLIICDVKMPVMDGVELVKSLAGQADCAIVMLSGFGDYPFVKETFEHGVFSYLLKPIDNDKLLETVVAAARALEKKRSERAYVDKLRNEVPGLKEKLMQDIVDGRVAGGEAAEKAAFYGMRVSPGYVLYVSPDQPEGAGARAAEVFAAAAGLTGAESAAVGRDKVFFLPGSPDEEKLRAALVSAADVYEKSGGTFSVGVSRPYAAADAFAAAVAAARAAAAKKLFPMLSSLSFEDGGRGYKPVVVEAMAYIAKNYHRRVSAKEAAAELFVSPSGLMHIFKKELNKTFNECLTAYRMMIAKKLLREGCFKVYEIAEMVGYADVKYFSQIFKQETSMTPTEYLSALQDTPDREG